MSKTYIKTSGHYGGATDDCISTHGHACKPYFGQDEALTASGHSAKELGPEEAFYSWIIYGGILEAEGLSLLLIHDEGSGIEDDRTRSTFNLNKWPAGAKYFSTKDKETGEVKTYTIQTIAYQPTSKFWVVLSSLGQLGFGRVSGTIRAGANSFYHYTYTPLPTPAPTAYAEGLTVDD